MGDGLEISGAGQSAVAIDELYAAAESLGRLAAEASSLTWQLALIDGRSSSVTWLWQGAPMSAVMAEGRIDQSRAALIELEIHARMLGAALATAADGYCTVEFFARDLMQGVLGTVARVPGALADGVDIGDISTLFTRAATVDLVRAGAMLADDLMLHAGGVPWPLIDLLGDNGIGATGVPFAAATIAGAASAVGVFRETPVALVGSTRGTISAQPAGFAPRFDRIPNPQANGGAQVAIEKYEVPGEPDRFEVYISGTVTFDPIATTEPWDMTSNIANAMGPGSGSYDSVALAMAEAGITESSPVQFTGYSQGGGTAAQLAASGDYNTAGLVTFGGPTGHIDLPDDVPTVIVEHRDDLVPALGGAQHNTHAVIVERDVFDGRDIPEDEVAPAHRRGPYRETAALMDLSDNPQLAQALAVIDGFGSDPRATITRTEYRFERVSSSASAPGEG